MSANGVALTRCFYCGKSDRLLIAKNRIESSMRCVDAAHGKVIDNEPCEKCEGFMKQGIIVIACDESKGKPDNPWRTGGWYVLKDEFFTRNIKDQPMLDRILKSRVCFIPQSLETDWGLKSQQPEEPQPEKGTPVS